MAAFEKDGLPMLSSNRSQVSDDGDASQSRRSSTRSASSLSIAINPMESHEREASLFGHTGPLRSQIDDNLAKRNEHLPRSGQYSKISALFDSHFYNALYGDAKGWARRFFSFLSPYIPGVMNPYAKVVQQWNQFFVISCLVAIFIDPLFFFLLSVEKDNKCIVLNWPMTKTLVVFRSITDFICLMHIFLQFRLAYVAPESRVVGAGELVDHPKKIALNYLHGYFRVDFFIVLPLPQIIILLILPNSLGSSGANSAKNLLLAAILVQYFPRLCRFRPLLAGQSPTGFIFGSVWRNFIIDLLTVLFSGHAVGSCWYLFGLQRVNQCLRDACHKSITPLCQFIDCGHGEVSDPGRRKIWTDNENATACLKYTDDGFPYGIYEKAVLLITEDSVIMRYMYSLFWGFQQISTLAGNLVPSYFVEEVVFTMVIIGLGLFLLARLIWKLQNYLQVLEKGRMEMSLRRYDLEQWMSHRRLPDDLRRRVRRAESYHWEAISGVNEEMHLEDLPEDLQTDIRRHLFKFIKKLRIFALMDDPIIDAFCAKLRRKTYIQGSRVLDNDGTIEKMTFIVGGRMESIGENGISFPLCEGDVCGEELLSCCLEYYSVNRDGQKIRKPAKRLISNRMVVCLTNIEAYSLQAADIEEVASLYSLQRNPQVQGAIRYESPYWRGLAATRIQVAWRYRRKRLSRADTAQSNQERNH